jgi:hypothetical protein
LIGLNMLDGTVKELDTSALTDNSNVVTNTVPVPQDSSIKITIDGKKLVTDIAPISVGGRTLVPIRVIFEAMHLKVEWNDVKKTAYGSADGIEIIIPLDSKEPTVNGKVIPIDVPAKSINGGIMIPVRFIAESFGAKVEWDSTTQTVVIKTKN